MECVAFCVNEPGRLRFKRKNNFRREGQKIIKKFPIEDILVEDNETEKIETDQELDTKKNEIPFEDCQDGYTEEKIDLELSNIREGLIVYHNAFGKGQVIKFDENRCIIFVKFDIGDKELSYEYANLKEIRCIKGIESVQYLDFSADDPEIQQILNGRYTDIQKTLNESEEDHQIDNNESDDIVISEKIEDGDEEITVHRTYVNEDTPWIIREKDEIIKKRDL